MTSWVRCVVTITLVILVGVVLSPLQFLAHRFNWPLCRTLPSSWPRITVRLLGLRIATRGAPDRRRPLMIAANHSSWLDIVVLLSIADVIFVAKKEVRKWPVVGWVARLQRTIFIERERRASTSNQVSDMAVRLAGGETVVLFPEGTSTDGNRVSAFKSALFGAAAPTLETSPDGGVLVQPVAIAYTRANGMPLGRFGRPFVATPGEVSIIPHLVDVFKEGAIDVEVCFGEPVRFDAASNRKQVAATVEARVRAMFQTCLYGQGFKHGDCPV